MSRHIIAILIISLIYVNCQLSVYRRTPANNERENLIPRSKTGKSNKQLSAVPIPGDGGSSGSGRSFWSILKNFFTGSSSSDEEEDQDILPFGLGDDFAEGINTILSRIHVWLNATLGMKPKGKYET